MKRTTQGVRAHQIEGMSADAYAGFTDRKLYILEDRAGIWRRLPKSAKKDRRPDAVAAFFQDGLVDLVRDLDLERELKEAGLIFLSEMDEKEDEQLTFDKFHGLRNGNGHANGDQPDADPVSDDLDSCNVLYENELPPSSGKPAGTIF